MGPHVTERLSAYMDGELPADERAQVDGHLRACPACSTHLEELRAVEAAARALPLEVPDGYFEAFPGRVRQRLTASRRRRLFVPAWIGAAAAAVVLAILTPRLLREPPPPAPTADAVQTLPALRPPAAPPAAKAESREADSATEAARAEPPPARPAKRDLRSSVGQRLEERPRPQTTPAPPEAGALLSRRDPGRPPSTAGEGYAAPPDDADRLQGAAAQSAPAERMPAGSAPRAKRMETEAENAAPAHADEAKTQRDSPALGALRDRAPRPSASETRYHALLGKTASSAAEARALRDAWRAYVRDEPAGPRADEARVRAVEAGAAAWRQGGDEKDRREAERDGREYLARKDALQPDRVRAVLQTLAR